MSEEKVLIPDERGRVTCPTCGDVHRVEILQVEAEQAKPGAPHCPFCRSPLSLEEVQHSTERKGLGFAGQEVMYCCPSCGACLGFSKWER